MKNNAKKINFYFNFNFEITENCSKRTEKIEDICISLSPSRACALARPIIKTFYYIALFISSTDKIILSCVHQTLKKKIIIKERIILSEYYQSVPSVTGELKEACTSISADLPITSNARRASSGQYRSFYANIVRANKTRERKRVEYIISSHVSLLKKACLLRRR